MLLGCNTLQLAQKMNERCNNICWLGSTYKVDIHDLFLGGTLACQWLTEIIQIYLHLMFVNSHSIKLKSRIKPFSLKNITINTFTKSKHWLLCLYHMKLLNDENKLNGYFLSGAEDDYFTERFEKALEDEENLIWQNLWDE